MQRTFETFITRMSECLDEHDFCRAMNIAARKFEIKRFAYIYFARENADDPQVISNYPQDWATRYHENQYHKIDPVVRQMTKVDDPFLWPADMLPAHSSEKGEALLCEAREFGISLGLTIPIHDRHSRIAAMTFAAPTDDQHFVETAQAYGPALQLMATCFHIFARRKLTDQGTIDGVSLTKRELECLKWAARGKSARDTADILGISRRTVSFHLDNVRRKFEVRTVSQAIAILATSKPDLL